MGYWGRLLARAFSDSLPQFRGQTPRAIVGLGLRSLIVYSVAFSVVFLMLGREQVLEEGAITLAFVIAAGAAFALAFLWNLLQAASRMEQQQAQASDARLSLIDAERHKADAELAQVRDTKPRLLISQPQFRFDGTWFLDITNEGAAADVRPEMRILDGHRFVPGHRDRYQAHWEQLQSATAHLLNGESRPIGIAQLITAPMGHGAALNYLLLYWDEVANSIASSPTTSWIVPAEGVLTPAITLEVRFPSEPSQMGDTIVRWYYLGANGLAEIPGP